MSGVSGEGKIEETWAGMELGMSEVATRRAGWYKDTIYKSAEGRSRNRTELEARRPRCHLGLATAAVRSWQSGFVLLLYTVFS